MKVPAARQEVCPHEMYKARCLDDEVIVMTEAFYGRMNIGNCVKTDYGSLGCGTDAIKEVDRKCSGRRHCQFPVEDLHHVQTCPDELKSYLSADYECRRVVMPKPHEMCIPSEKYVLTENSGYLASSTTAENKIGSSDCPWKIVAKPGQSINLTVYNFATAPISSSDPRICYQLADIIDGKSKPRTHTECEEGHRISKMYVSKTNEVEISLHSHKNVEVHFLIGYQIIGCPDLKVSGTATVTRNGNDLVVTCDHSGLTWHLRCNGLKWEGAIGNCTAPLASGSVFSVDNNFPYGILIIVAIGVALGVFIGGLLLTIASVYMKKNTLKKYKKQHIPVPDSRIYGTHNKRLDSYHAYQYGPHPMQLQNPPPGCLIDPRAKEFDFAGSQYQPYGPLEDRSHSENSSPNAHVYESPKFIPRSH